MDVGDRDDARGTSGYRPSPAGDGQARNVGDEDTGLAEQAELERERGAAEQGGEQGAAAEGLGDDDGDEVAVPVREGPEVLEHRVDGFVLGREHVEVRLALRPAEEARLDPGVRPVEGNVDGV